MRWYQPKMQVLESLPRLEVSNEFPVEVLALGSELKNTVCAGRGCAAWISEPLDDLSKAADFRQFLENVATLRRRLRGAEPVIACDAHPNYAATRFAAAAFRDVVRVQHHHAHGVACAADAGIALPAIAVVCDGTGYGTDGAVWGGELLLIEAGSFTRLAHLMYFPVPGGDAAARSPWRSALGALRAALVDREMPNGFLLSVDRTQRFCAERQLETRLNTSSTSSLGRLFDAVAAITGVCSENACEGQAAATLERIAMSPAAPAFSYEFHRPSRSPNGRFDVPGILDWRPMLREIVDSAGRGVEAGEVSARFHRTLIEMFTEAVTWAAAATGVPRVVFSGGCFLNQVLRRGLVATMTERAFQVGTHQRVPTGDAGISLGQAIVAAHKSPLPQLDMPASRMFPASGVPQCV